MKVLGIMGSPRIGGNSDLLLDQALSGAKQAGAEAEKIVLVREKISGCLDCGKCNEGGICGIKDDMAEIQQKLLDADAVIHAVPTYFWAMTSQMKAYLDRWCVFFDADWQWHKFYESKMKGKRMGVITVCADPNSATADPIVHSFKMTCEFTGMILAGVFQTSAAAKGEIAGNASALKEAYDLGKKLVTG
jgi:multimeric flavodoxin WrbA